MVVFPFFMVSLTLTETHSLIAESKLSQIDRDGPIYKNKENDFQLQMPPKGAVTT